MGKHAIGGMRSMIVPNRKADMRFRKKSYLRNKNRVDGWERFQGKTDKEQYREKGW